MRPSCLALLFAIVTLWTQQSFAATELEERAIIPSSAHKALLSENFSQLEQSSHAYRTEKSRTASGLWKLTLFYAGIQSAIDAQTVSQEPEAAFRRLEEKTTRWMQQYPTSPSAYIAHSMVLIGHGWSYRGDGTASTVKPESWAPFRKHIAMARQNLESYKAVAAKDPRWYETMLTIARAESWDRKQFDRLLNEALDREPLFYQTYFLAIEYLLPKWHGGNQEIEAFANDATRRTSTQEGRGMYARIYWFASQTQFQNDIFADSLAVWPHMKAGFEDVVKRYPDAWNFNNYAKFSCLARDKTKARELLKRVSHDFILEAWNPPSLHRWCSEWALQ